MKLSSRPTLSLAAIEPLLKNQSDLNWSVMKQKRSQQPTLSNPQKQEKPVQAQKREKWAIFSSTFLTIFFAEMGDKTQLATLLMSAESQSPWLVFTGAATALVATSLLGVLLGRWLASRLSPRTLEVAAGTLLLFISVLLLWDVVQI